MRVDLAIKEKALQRLTRELDECKKTIKKLQKENECKWYCTIRRFSEWNTNKVLALLIGNRGDKALKKPYDPAQFTEKPNPSETKLQERIKLLEMDYKSLHDKRLQDVNLILGACYSASKY